jgi:putative transcriptional regulator
MKIPQVVLDGISEFVENTESGRKAGRAFSVSPSSAQRVRHLRAERLNMTQQEFALRFGIPIRTLQKWEQGAREPEGPARAYLTVIERIPEHVIAALSAEVMDRVEEVSQEHIKSKVCK